LARKLATGKIWMAPLLENKEGREIVRNPSGDFWGGRKKRIAAIHYQGSKHIGGSDGGWLCEGDTERLECCRVGGDGHNPITDLDGPSLRVDVHGEVPGEGGRLLRISRRIKEVLVCHAWRPAEAVAKEVDAVLDGVVTSCTVVCPDDLDRDDPTCRIAKAREPRCSEVDVAIVEHREGEVPSAGVKLIEDFRYGHQGLTRRA
jgi:hypothetical protein